MTEEYASRGGLKLESALRTFRCRVRGLHALDVGASHGGFTDCLLRFGAARVTAVDVGHGQLRPVLRQDPRVELLEHTHFKRAPLSVATGPFDFFVMDVSHASARAMLRGIAARVRVGTMGVILVKPQFELPSALVPAGGVVESRNLRKLAFNRFKKRAWTLGFRVLGKADCPVHGGDGNVEILTWLRYEGEPAEADGRPPQGPIEATVAVVPRGVA